MARGHTHDQPARRGDQPAHPGKGHAWRRLSPQVEEYQAKLAELEEKERLIERLKSERQGPVRLLEALSTELPDFVWLTQLTQRAGMVTIDGMAASLVSIADYIRKLEDSDWFQNVELGRCFRQ